MASQGNDCYFYYYSNCSRGDSCAFRHCPEALGNEVVCSLWREGRCFRAICSYRHMEIDKQRSAIPCYWESQPSGCLKDHCPFLHSKPRGNITSSSADVWKTLHGPSVDDLPSIEDAKSAAPVVHVAGPQRGSIPTPVVEPIIVNPQDDQDDTSSVEVSPVKKISFSSKTIKLGTKDLKTGGDEASMDFGIKTLSQLRENKTTSVISTTSGAVPSPVVKSVNHRNVVSVRNVNQNESKNAEEDPKKVLPIRPSMKRKQIVANDAGDGDAKSSRKFIFSQERQPPTRILLKSGGDSVDSRRPTTVLRLSGEGTMSSHREEVESKVGEKGDTGIKTLEQIRKERRMKVSSPLSTENKTGVKTLDEIRRNRKVAKIVTGGSQENVTGVKSLAEIRRARVAKRNLEDATTGDDDIGVKTLKQIRQEKAEASSALVTTSQSVDSGVKNLEQIRRERIARRLGLVQGQNGQQESKNTRQLIVKRTEKVDGSEDSIEGDQLIVGSVLGRLGPAVTGQGDKRKLVTGGDSGGAGMRKESTITNQLTKNKSEASPTADVKLSLPKRRVTVSTAVIEGAEMGKRDEKMGMKDRLGRRREASGGSEEEAVEVVDGASSVNARLGLKKLCDPCEGEEDESKRRKEVKKDEEKKPEMRKISIKRRGDGVKSPAKRRADREIYQPPGAKLKGTTSRIGSLSEPQETEEESKCKETNSGKAVVFDKSPKKRQRITFQTDSVTSLTSDTTDKGVRRLKLKKGDVTESEADKKIAEESPDQNPLSDRRSSNSNTTNELPEPPASKRRKGAGLRERLLQQSQKFAVGKTAVVAEETVTIDGVSATVKRNVAEANGRSLESKQTKSLTDEMEDGVVSSSGVRSGISSSVRVVGKSLPEEKADQVVEKPSSTTIIPTNAPLSNSTEDMSPDTTNPRMPKKPPIRSSMSNLKPTQHQAKGDTVDVLQRREKKEPVEDPKRKMSMTEDEFAGLLDDVGTDGDDFNDVDDDDALLEELEDLINA